MITCYDYNFNLVLVLQNVKEHMLLIEYHASVTIEYHASVMFEYTQT